MPHRSLEILLRKNLRSGSARQTQRKIYFCSFHRSKHNHPILKETCNQPLLLSFQLCPPTNFAKRPTVSTRTLEQCRRANQLAANLSDAEEIPAMRMCRKTRTLRRTHVRNANDPSTVPPSSRKMLRYVFSCSIGALYMFTSCVTVFVALGASTGPAARDCAISDRWHAHRRPLHDCALLRIPIACYLQYSSNIS